MAFYNSGFPATYPQIYPSFAQPVQPVQPQNQQQSGLIWVSGEAGAKAYLVAPNTTVQLWDSESQTVYLKSADASGMPSIKVLDYTIRENGKNSPVQPSALTDDNLSVFATKSEIRAISDRISAIQTQIDAMKGEKTE